jgi:Integrase core domain/Integrase zinc binding domain
VEYLKEKKGEPLVIANRLQRYVIRLSIFDYELKHRKGKDNGNADGLSRLPVKEEQSNEDKLEENNFVVNNICEGKEMWLDMKKISEYTESDEMLCKLRKCILQGATSAKDQTMLKHFYAKLELLSVEYGCVMLGERVVIPRKLVKSTLRLLHTNHLGITRMKQLARKYVYWQGINKEIETYIGECESCQILRKDDQRKVYGKWADTSVPFERVHVDFFHFKGNSIFIFVDVYSRWMEIKLMRKTDAKEVIKVLEKIFYVFGLPSEIVSDNGPPFASQELKEFLEARSIKVTHSPTYHPQSNGTAERAVQTVKTVLRKFVNDAKNSFQINQAIDKFLHNYRNLPSAQHQIVPSERIFAYQPRWAVSNLKFKRVDFHDSTTTNQGIVNKLENLKPKDVEFKSREKVLYITRHDGYNYSYRAEVVKRISQHIYMIKIGSLVKTAHTNQLRKSILKPFIENKVSVEPTKVKTEARKVEKIKPVELRKSARIRAYEKENRRKFVHKLSNPFKAGVKYK